MKRKGEEDDYFCFECRFFGGKTRCTKFKQPLNRRPWDCSCDSFKHWKEEDND